MKIIGLTGGIASGKNFIADIFAKNGAAIFDADKEVHDLLSLDKSTISAVKKLVPESFIDEEIDRKVLGKIVFASQNKLRDLEEIIHPKIREIYQEFLKKSQAENKDFLVLNIPLLLESKGYECDYIIGIIVAKDIQKQRFIDREKSKNPHMVIAELNEKFEQIIKKQMSNEQREKHANFIIKNDGVKAHTEKQIEDILKVIF